MDLELLDIDVKNQREKRRAQARASYHRCAARRAAERAASRQDQLEALAQADDDEEYSEVDDTETVFEKYGFDFGQGFEVSVPGSSNDHELVLTKPKSKPKKKSRLSRNEDDDETFDFGDSDDNTFAIFVKDFTGKPFTLLVKSSDTIDNVKVKIQVKGYLQGNFNLIFAGKFLDGNLTVASYAIQPESTLYMFAGVRGGGKRAKTSTGARRTTHDKDSRLTELRDAIGSTVMKIRAKNGMRDALLGIADTLMAHGGVIEQSPSEVVTASLGALNRHALRALQSQLTSTNNVDHRMMLIMKLFYKQQLTTLNELRNLIDETEQSLLTITELAMVHQFCKDDDGTMSWSDVNTVLVDVIEGKAVRAGANLVAGAAPAAAPAMEI
jgi:hypothetical protein